MNRRDALTALAAIAGLPCLVPSFVRAEQQESGRPALLMFDDPGCPYCRQWHREVGPAYRNSPEGKLAPLRILQLRAPRPEGLKLAAPIRATPTFVLVQDGREIGRITGYGGADFFWGQLEPLLKKLKPGERA